MARGSTDGSGRKLVIVESPAKAKTINKYLGRDFQVKASMGHVRDLPSKGMGVDLKTFEPAYEILESRGKVVSELKKLAKDAPDIYLATDLDREGEAIAWHLQQALGIPDDRVKRVIFNAITKTEIQKAFKSPHKIDISRVNAQQARRILDRIVGYEISPLLWRKVARGLSAGRVQSVAVRLIVEREREIESFVPEEYWKIGGVFTADTDPDGCKKLAARWHDFLGILVAQLVQRDVAQRRDAQRLGQQFRRVELREPQAVVRLDVLRRRIPRQAQHVVVGAVRAHSGRTRDGSGLRANSTTRRTVFQLRLVERTPSASTHVFGNPCMPLGFRRLTIITSAGIPGAKPIPAGRAARATATRAR